MFKCQYCHALYFKDDHDAKDMKQVPKFFIQLQQIRSVLSTISINSFSFTRASQFINSSEYDNRINAERLYQCALNLKHKSQLGVWMQYEV